MSKIDCALVEISLVKIYMFIKIKRWVLKRFVSFRWPEEEELVFRLFPGEPSSSPVLESPGNACQRQILKLHPDLLTQNLGVWDWGILNEYPQCLHTNIRTTGGKEWCRGWGGKGGKELALTIPGIFLLHHDHSVYWHEGPATTKKPQESSKFLELGTCHWVFVSE